MARRLRWPSLAVLLLLAGAAINIGVTWLCVRTAKPRSRVSPWMTSVCITPSVRITASSAGVVEHTGEVHEVTSGAKDFGYRVAIMSRTGIGPTTKVDHNRLEALMGEAERVSWDRPRVQAKVASGQLVHASVPRWVLDARRPHTYAYTIRGAGWPFICAWSAEGGDELLARVNAGLLTGRIAPGPALTNPYWPGLALNTTFYALLLTPLVLFAPARRHLRLRRGRCPRCAYDLRGNLASGCPECGWNRLA